MSRRPGSSWPRAFRCGRQVGRSEFTRWSYGAHSRDRASVTPSPPITPRAGDARKAWERANNPALELVTTCHVMECSVIHDAVPNGNTGNRRTTPRGPLIRHRSVDCVDDPGRLAPHRDQTTWPLSTITQPRIAVGLRVASRSRVVLSRSPPKPWLSSPPSRQSAPHMHHGITNSV